MEIDNEDFFTENPYFSSNLEPCEREKIAQSHANVITILNVRRILDLIWCITYASLFLKYNDSIYAIFCVIGTIGLLTDIFISLILPK